MRRFIARACLSAIFILGGFGALMEPGQRVKALSNVGLPESETLVRINGLAMLVGGICLLLGILPRLTALMLAGTLIPTTLAGHAFWKETDEKARMMHQIHFLKNVGLLGGLILVSEVGNKEVKES